MFVLRAAGRVAIGIFDLALIGLGICCGIADVTWEGIKWLGSR